MNKKIFNRKSNQRRIYKEDSDKLFIYGKHVVDQALENHASFIEKVWLSTSFSDARLNAKVRRLACQVLPLEEKKLPGGLPRDINHQGIIAVLGQKSVVKSYNSYMLSSPITYESCFLVLSEIQDPQNVGAMIRSASAFGVQAVLLPKYKQAPLTGTVAKVSAGMIFTVPIVEIGNLNNTLIDLKERGVAVYGLEGEGGVSIYEQEFSGASAFVVGNEANGLRNKTRECCDDLLTIPLHPRCESLNAGSAVVASLTLWKDRLSKTKK